MGKKTITFVIDTENGITAYPTRTQAEASGEGSLFSTQDQLDQVTAGCPAARLIDIWNGIPGVTEVKKFTSRQIALGRIWKAIQNLEPDAVAEEAPAVAPKTEPSARKARKLSPKEDAAINAALKANSKKTEVIAMLLKPGGATLDAIMKATGWQAHTVRGFMATVPKKLGIEVASTKVDGERTYSASAVAAAGV